MLIRQSLSDFPVRVNLHVARDGEQALAILADSQFDADLIILDLGIPRISGIEVLERIGQMKVPPIVIFSSSMKVAETRRAIELGARDYVQKPSELRAFTDAVVGMVKKWAVPEINGATNAG